MPSTVNRRTFLGAAVASSLSISLSSGIEPSASDKIAVAIIGTGGRGTGHAKTFAQQAGVTVDYVCDVDRNRAGAAAKAVESLGKPSPKVVSDFRAVLDDKTIDAVVVATCNHWHAPATILANSAGKHVYVEKPCSHNPWEGELMVQAARKHKRQVQMGNQRRSFDKISEAMQRLRDGIIGPLYLAQSWYVNNRPTIGRGEAKEPPKELDYAMWQGPAPARPYRSNYLHYNWHWFWHWGNGELGNNGIHMIDLCRWGLSVDFPMRVSSTGGRYRFDDDQETPDTQTVAFDFAGRKAITWEGLSCSAQPDAGRADVVFHGEKGTLRIAGGSYSIHDLKGKETEKVAGKGGDQEHIGNFLAAIRENGKLNSEIEEGHKSTLLCHLGNIAHRTGRALRCDPKDGKIIDDTEATGLWKREYAKRWEPVI